MFSTPGLNRRPERIENKDYDFSADVWSLGLTLLECAVGKYPYEIDGGPLGLMMQICNEVGQCRLTLSNSC
jgi:serine/threonine protein kinase